MCNVIYFTEFLFRDTSCPLPTPHDEAKAPGVQPFTIPGYSSGCFGHGHRQQTLAAVMTHRTWLSASCVRKCSLAGGLPAARKEQRSGVE